MMCHIPAVRYDYLSTGSSSPIKDKMPVSHDPISGFWSYTFRSNVIGCFSPSCSTQ